MESRDYINLCKQKLEETLKHYNDKEVNEVDDFVISMLDNIIVLNNPLLNADLIIHQITESYYPNELDAAHFVLNLYGMKPSFDFLDTYLDIFFERLYEDELNEEVTQSKINEVKDRLAKIDPNYLDTINKKESEYKNAYTS